MRTNVSLSLCFVYCKWFFHCAHFCTKYNSFFLSFFFFAYLQARHAFSFYFIFCVAPSHRDTKCLKVMFGKYNFVGVYIRIHSRELSHIHAISRMVVQISKDLTVCVRASLRLYKHSGTLFFWQRYPSDMTYSLQHRVTLSFKCHQVTYKIF